MTKTLYIELTNEDVTRKCLVCGDKASGINFNGLTCQSCKVFFRRYAFKLNKLQKCQWKTCRIGIKTRTSCQICRLEKCFKIGMKREFVNKSKIYLNLSEHDGQDLSEHLTLKAHEQYLIDQVLSAMSVFCDETKLRIINNETNLIEAFNVTANCVEKFIKFCKSLEPFRQLPPSDQLILVKSVFSKAIAVRFAFAFNPEKDGAPIENDQPKNTATFVSLATMDPWENFQTFYRNFLCSLKSEMENDSIMKNLIVTYLLFIPQENLSCPEWIRYQHHIYSRLLQRYFEHKYHDPDRASTKYSKITQLLGELVYTKLMCKQMFAEQQSSELCEIGNEIFGCI